MKNKLSILFNGAGILVGVVSLVFALKYELSSNDEPPCSGRYPRSMRFVLDREGEPLATEDLQSQLGNSDWGLEKSAQVVRLKSGPAKHALQLDLRPLTKPAEGKPERKGVGFSWAPDTMGKPLTACLAYSVFVPKEFAFGPHSLLPGFEGRGKDLERDPEGVNVPAFSTLFEIGPGGVGHVMLQTSQKGTRGHLERSEASFEVPSGQWVRFEQELALNEPEDDNGGLRVWVNGKLILEKRNAVYRKDPAVGIAGVLAQVSYGDRKADPAKGSSKLWITPFELFLR